MKAHNKTLSPMVVKAIMTHAQHREVSHKQSYEKIFKTS